MKGRGWGWGEEEIKTHIFIAYNIYVPTRMHKEKMIKRQNVNRDEGIKVIFFLFLYFSQTIYISKKKYKFVLNNYNGL